MVLIGRKGEENVHSGQEIWIYDDYQYRDLTHQNRSRRLVTTPTGFTLT
jgi:hypothetical protein